MMAVLSAGGLAALITWAQGRPTEKGDILIPCSSDDHLADFKAHVCKCPEVESCSTTYIPGSSFAIAKPVLRPGFVLPVVAPRA